MNTESQSQFLRVPIEDIIPNRFQPRLTFDEEGLNELAASIKEHGIIQPLVLRRLGDKYEIIAGERRYKASRMAGLTTVPAIINEMDDKKSAELAIVENIQRRDLTPIEEAKSYKELLDKGYLTQDELAKRMGLSQSAISNKLRLLSLADEVQQALMDGKISERHARSLLKLTSKEEQIKWLNTIIEERLTVQNLDKKLKNLIQEEKKEINVEPIPVVDTNNTISKSTNNNESLFQDTQPIPNKFFNFLEDEVANMNMDETPVENTDDGIELLDFDVSIPTKKDMTKAESLVNTLIGDLTINTYKTNLNKEETDKEIKYVITIQKED